MVNWRDDGRSQVQCTTLTFQPLHLVSSISTGEDPQTFPNSKGTSCCCLSVAQPVAIWVNIGERWTNVFCWVAMHAKGSASAAAAVGKAAGYLCLQPSKDEHNLWVQLQFSYILWVCFSALHFLNGWYVLFFTSHHNDAEKYLSSFSTHG